MQNAVEDAALHGVRVLEFAQLVAAPSAGLLLADYGADVVKVEPPSGDAARRLGSASTSDSDRTPVFDTYNRNKRALSLDLKSPSDREEAWRLIERADVVIESARPGAMDALGVGSDAVLARCPRAIYASMSGFGWGPEGIGRRGVDLVVQAESGIMSTTGPEGGPPMKVGFTIVDAAAGHAFTHGILAALFRRTRTGRGGIVRTSLYSVAVHLQSAPLAEYVALGSQPPRLGNSAPMSAPADMFQCSDGQIVISAYTEAHWGALTAALRVPELFDDPRFTSIKARLTHRRELIDALERVLRTGTAAHWIELLSEAGLVVGEARDHAQVIEQSPRLDPDLVSVTPELTAVANPVDILDGPRSGPTPLLAAVRGEVWNDELAENGSTFTPKTCAGPWR